MASEWQAKVDQAVAATTESAASEWQLKLDRAITFTTESVTSEWQIKLRDEVGRFVAQISMRQESSLFGVNDRKTIGTHLERAFHRYLSDR